MYNHFSVTLTVSVTSAIDLLAVKSLFEHLDAYTIKQATISDFGYTITSNPVDVYTTCTDLNEYTFHTEMYAMGYLMEYEIFDASVKVTIQ